MYLSNNYIYICDVKNMTMDKILINIDPKLKKEFSKNCKAFGVTMTTVITGAIKEFNEQSKSKTK